MYNSRLINLLKTLDNKELKSFEKYLVGLYGKHQTAISVFQHIKKYHPVYEHKNLDKEHITIKLLKVKNSKRVSNEASQIYEWLKEFLVWNRLQRATYKTRHHQILLDTYLEGGFDSFANQTIQQVEELNSTVNGSIPERLSAIGMYHEAYFEQAGQNSQTNRIYLDKTQQKLETISHIIHLKYACECFTRHYVYGETLSHTEIELIKTSDILFQNYQFLYQAHCNDKPESVEKAKAFFEKTFHQIPISEQQFILSSLNSKIAQWIKQGHLEFVQISFEIYRFGLEHNILCRDGDISSIIFNNIVNTSIASGNVLYAEKFVEKYSNRLSSEFGNEMKILALARVAFGSKDYQKAKDILAKRKFDNIFHKLISNLVYICCLFELEEDFAIIENKSRAFSQLLTRRDYIGKDYATAFKNFNSILKKLLYEKSKKDLIKKELQEKKPIFFKLWLEKQLGQYQKKY